MQVSAAIIFGTWQNNVSLVYIFVKFPQLVSLFHYGDVALLSFKNRIPTELLSNCKAADTCEDSKRKQSFPVVKKYLEKTDIKL